MSKRHFDAKIPNLEHGVHYSCSWTSAIRYGFNGAAEILGNQFQSHAFIDVGCGMGKVTIAWTQMLRKRNWTQRVLGIDYSEALIRQAEINYHTAIANAGDFLCTDASTFNYVSLGERLIIYLFNPFDAEILAKVLDGLCDLSSLIIYNVPQHEAVLLARGYVKVDQCRSFHTLGNTAIFARAGRNCRQRNGSGGKERVVALAEKTVS